MIYYPKRAWKVYREGGLDCLRSQTSHFLRSRVVPFRSEIWLRNKINQVRYGTVPHPLTVLWIDPDIVDNFIRNVNLNRRFDIGKIRGGDWDKNQIPLSQWRVYQGLKQRFENGMDWEDTEYYQMGCDRIRENRHAWQCTSPAEFLAQRCQYIDELYESIRQHGYQRQTKLLKDQSEDTSRGTNVTTRHVNTHEVSIAIGRDGEMMVEAGIHRLCIARLLDLDEIPIQILVRHRKWQETRNRVHNSGTVPPEIDPSHPDLQDVLD